MAIGRILTYACAGLLGMGLAIPQPAKASTWNQKTIFTVSGPIEIPGRVLPAGQYVFKLADSQSNRNVVEVYNKNEDHLYGTFLAIPDYRLQPAGKPIITFTERAANAPEAVKAWFYPGDNYGHAFVYPKKQALALAKANNEPVPSVPENTNTSELKNAPLKAQQPSQEETEIAQAPPPPAQENQAPPATQNQAPPPAQTQTQPSTQNNPPANSNPPANQPSQLPQTGSPLPLIGLIGFLSLGLAGSLRLVAAGMR